MSHIFSEFNKNSLSLTLSLSLLLTALYSHSLFSSASISSLLLADWPHARKVRKKARTERFSSNLRRNQDDHSPRCHFSLLFSFSLPLLSCSQPIHLHISLLAALFCVWCGAKRDDDNHPSSASFFIYHSAASFTQSLDHLICFSRHFFYSFFLLILLLFSTCPRFLVLLMTLLLSGFFKPISSTHLHTNVHTQHTHTHDVLVFILMRVPMHSACFSLAFWICWCQSN